jgi:hypothetical protein
VKEFVMTALPVHNPPAEPGRIAPGEPCACAGGCGLHSKECPAKHLHRFPGTKTITHLDRTPAGVRCPYCKLAETRPTATSDRAEAAMRRPNETAEQDDLFNAELYRVPKAKTRQRDAA